MGRSSSLTLSPGLTEEPQGLCVLSPLLLPRHSPGNHGTQMSGIKLKMPKAHDAVRADPHGNRQHRAQCLLPLGQLRPISGVELT